MLDDIELTGEVAADGLSDAARWFVDGLVAQKAREAQEDAELAERRARFEPEPALDLPGVTGWVQEERILTSVDDLNAEMMHAYRDMTHAPAQRKRPMHVGGRHRRGRSSRPASNSRRRGSRRSAVARDDGGGDPPGDSEPAGGVVRHSTPIGGSR